ncbi:hypothetical protein [Streptomyces sp. ITFR-16]|uniref:hypothetical protein n=1 Tax=Streptomyces sp. ITFR-16 TaxID=3075198 RepID=UPI002889E576|nr:hypothetical protein [Streptomyces sp. ITFR-16]WNI22828.1 hypothetical protein RLT58_13230 [Streptomyces sp. ITFR-16]
MSTSESSRFVRLRVEMVLEITDPDALSGTALESLAAEYGEPGGESAEERTHAETAVREDGAEALASLIDPFDLVGEVPGVELTQASWSSESIDYDPEDPDGWDLDDGDDEAAEEYDDEDGSGRGASGVPHNGEEDDQDGGTVRRV